MKTKILILKVSYLVLFSLIFLLSSCSKESIENDNPTYSDPQAFVGPSGPCDVFFDLDIETYQVIEAEGTGDLSILGEIQCALIEPVNDRFRVSGCIDQHGEGTLTLDCIPGFLGFTNLDQTAPDLEPEECTVEINGDDYSIIDEDGVEILAGTFDGPVLAPWGNDFASIAVDRSQQIINLKNEVLTRGGEIIQVSNVLEVLKFPATTDDPLTIVSFDPSNNTILNNLEFDDTGEIFHSTYFRYDPSKAIPVLTHITEREKYSIEGHDIPLVRKNLTKFHSYQFEM